jgi:hypothetical protein
VEKKTNPAQLEKEQEAVNETLKDGKNDTH